MFEDRDGWFFEKDLCVRVGLECFEAFYLNCVHIMEPFDRWFGRWLKEHKQSGRFFEGSFQIV